jgi:hypothetical protein
LRKNPSISQEISAQIDYIQKKPNFDLPANLDYPSKKSNLETPTSIDWFINQKQMIAGYVGVASLINFDLETVNYDLLTSGQNRCQTELLAELQQHAVEPTKQVHFIIINQNYLPQVDEFSNFWARRSLDKVF